MSSQGSRAPRARRASVVLRRDRRTRAAFRSRSRRRVPACLAALLGVYSLDGSGLVPDRGGALVELTVPEVSAAAEALGHRLTVPQARVVTGVLVAVSVEIAARRAGVLDDDRREVIAWGRSVDEQWLWSEKNRLLGGAA